jgi:hypothetical protein
MTIRNGKLRGLQSHCFCNHDNAAQAIALFLDSLEEGQGACNVWVSRAGKVFE